MDETVPREIDPYALHQIFTYWTTLPGYTAFKGIKELPPGHFLKVSNGRILVTRYWDIPFYPPEEQAHSSREEIVEEARELLEDAIRLRLRADVPVGCYLSGGLDSSGVSTIVARNHNAHVRTYGIRFGNEAFDEGSFQTEMVSFLNVHHVDVRASEGDIGSVFPEVLWHCEKPLLRTAPVPLFLLSGIVRDSGLKVVLTGEGGDEVFAGYNIFREMKVRRFWAKNPDSRMRAALVGRLYPYILKDPRLRNMLQSFFAKGLTDVDDPFYSHRIRWDNTRRIKRLLTDDWLAAADPEREKRDLENLTPKEFPTWEPMAQAQYIEMAIFLSNYLLSSQGDRVAMGHSVEIRLPYLDYRLIDLMGRVPARHKMLGLEEKHILKQVFRGILPDRIVNRSKHPYRAPIRDSLLNRDTEEYVSVVLSGDRLRSAGIFDPVKVERLLKTIRAEEPPREFDEMALAGILSTQIIHDQFVKNFPKDPPKEVVLNRTITRV
jgi:asparagine synthase (glutamine-hydrolysing)